jgi:hypothetical protein
MLSGNKLGDAGARVVIEDFLDGEEASFIVMVDGKNVLPLASSQDHKRIFDGDTGPNTGGMGAYSPAPVVTPEIHAKAMREVILPTVRGMEADGMPVHRLPLRRPDDRQGRLGQDARVQLPHGRPGNAADHDAPEVRPGRRCSNTASPARSTRSRPNGTAASRWASCSPPPTTRTRPKKGDVISGLPAESR